MNPMRKGVIYITIVVTFILAVSFIVVKYTGEQKARAVLPVRLKDRTGEAAKSPEWPQVRARAAQLMSSLHNNPSDAQAALQLASLFIQEARVTGDFAYYDQAALKYVNGVLEKEPDNFEALVYKALLQLSQHHFTEGLATAEKAQKINPYNAFVYGIMVDAHVELGNYELAVQNSDKMVSIRPDLRSYSRIAYLREIHGDYPGAVEAMTMAVSAGYPGQEGTEWCRYQLGKLYENSGNLREAEMQYRISLDERPGYAYALAGLGSLASSRKQYDSALSFYRQAYEQITDFSFQEAQAEIYLAKGDKIKALQLSKEVITKMSSFSARPEDSAGHYSDRELAYAYLHVNDNDKALKHAMLEYNRRPDNIDVNETLAWIYHARNEKEKALSHIKVALKTNSKNPTLLCRAGVIYYSTGDTLTAIKYLSEVLQTNAPLSATIHAKVTKVLNDVRRQ